MTLESEVLSGSDLGAVAVLLHGRGADRSDMRGLARELPGEWTFVLPNAPHAGAPWGYGPGYAWYRFLGGDRPERESFSESLAALDQLIEGLPALLGEAPRVVVLGGFSQGGTIALGYALSRPWRVKGVLNMSGFLPVHDEVPVEARGTGGAPVFWGHGRHDPSIPFALAEAGRERLSGIGVALEAHDYAIGHWIDGDEVRHVAAFLERLRDG